MPRDGSNIYSQPFPDVEEGTTIESTVYNGFTNDVAQDLNAPRPISAGGTGADNAIDAMVNLGGETSKVEVTNYDSHPFAAGSFYSKTTATNPPVAGHAFAGYCYVAVVSGVATSDMFIEVRDRDEPVQPGSQYVRQKKAGVWSAWMKPVGTASGTTPPTPASSNALWWDPTRGKLFIYYVDADTSQWVEAVAIPDVNADEVLETIDDHAVRYDAAQALTSTQQAQARANIAVTKKNYIINGAMMISQENGTTGGSSNLYYPVDQFVFQGVLSGTILIAQVAGTTPGGSPNRIRVTVPLADTSIAAAEGGHIDQNIEAFRTNDLLFGTSSAKTVTLQFGVKAPAGTYCVVLQNANVNRSYVAEYVISAGENNTDVVKSITIPGDTTIGWGSGTQIGLRVSWALFCGTNYHQAAGSWGTANAIASPNQSNFAGSTSNVFELFDVSLTEGSVAPPFQVPDVVNELLLCKRYFELFDISARWDHALTVGTSTGFAYTMVTKRITPALTTVLNALSGWTLNGYEQIKPDSFLVNLAPSAAGPVTRVANLALKANARL